MMLRSAVLCLALAAPVAAQSLDPGPVTPDWSQDYRRAAMLFEAGDKLRAGCVFYRGQFRARLALAVHGDSAPDGMRSRFAALQDVVGRPINEWLGGDRADWIAAMTCARTWAAQNDDPALPRAAHAAAYARTLAGLDGLIAGLPPAEALRETRAANGLANR